LKQTLLTVQGLTTAIGRGPEAARVVDDVDLEVCQGETFCLLGESGCGKSMTALSLMRLLPPSARIAAGSVVLGGRDLLRLSELEMRAVRGRRVAMIFQEPQSSLNPVLSVGTQVQEVLVRHTGLDREARGRRAVELLDWVGIPEPNRRLGEYPHQLSGGMKQRVMIAMALAAEPELLIADEPTTALDVTIQAQVLELLQRLQRDSGMAIMLITHDLGVVARMADRVAVMYAGHIVEQVGADRFFRSPAHPYSRKLFDSVPTAEKREAELAVIPGTVPPLSARFTGCRFAARCPHAFELCAEEPPEPLVVEDGQIARCHLYRPEFAERLAAARQAERAATAGAPRDTAGEDVLLEVEDLRVHFPITRGVFKRTVGHVYAVDGVSLAIRSGTTLALVGESGCGKTTAGKGILRLMKPTAGKVVFDGEDLATLPAEALRRRRADIQFIFQDPYASMNPRMSVADVVAEGMIAQGIGGGRAERERRVVALLQEVGMDPEVRFRYPHEFSGGQRQRLCIARALAVEPKLIICDEPTSALDVSVQAQILNLLRRLQRERGLAYLFITHNLGVVDYLADEVAVMYLGRIVEHGRTREVLDAPAHPYTQALLSAVPTLERGQRREVLRVAGDLPSPSAPPAGCHFHPRCPVAVAECDEEYPAQVPLSDSHAAACRLLEPYA